ncbi:MAG: 50S ribosomal protein L4 [Methanomassiliicoccales archaeon]|jgi:large subunit ribosomal protein L4e|nr:50S ribosomal protein L4 [Methanomassiliicoccales archaeon]
MVSNERVNVYSLKGEIVKTIDLPPIFNTEFRPDLIRRAVSAMEANKRQPYGASPEAGMRHAVSTWGKGRGVARVQRLSQGARGAQSPGTVGGRRAHPPYAERDWSKKINRREKLLAKLSALAAVADPVKVRRRGHRFADGVTLPIVVEDDIEKISKTAEVLEVLESIGVVEDVRRAIKGTNIRAGRGKMRNRRYRIPRSLLIVVSDKDAPLVRSVENLPGVEISDVSNLNVKVLAPGGDPGRLTLFSESALIKLGEWSNG